MKKTDISLHCEFSTNNTIRYYTFKTPITREMFIHFLTRDEGFMVLPFISVKEPFTMIEGNGTQWAMVQCN